MPGWYPDPSGQSGRYRYWTGSSWSAQTTADPTSAPPDRPAGGQVGDARAPDGRADPGRPRRRGLLVGLLALVVVIVLVAGVFLIRGLLGPGGTVASPDPSSTASSYDDSSPLATASPTPTPTPTPTPSPTPSPSPSRSPSPAKRNPLEACPIGGPTIRQPHPGDGRLHGGGLSFKPHSDWADPGDYLQGLSWAYDVTGQSQRTEPRWLAILAVGALRTADGFDNPHQSTEGVMQCIASSGYYDNVVSRKDIASRAVTVDGKPGWELRSEIRVDEPDLSVEGDVVDVIVIDAGANESLAMFVGAVPIGDRARLATLNSTIHDLQVG